MKKIIYLLLAFTMLATAGCQKEAENEKDTANDTEVQNTESDYNYKKHLGTWYYSHLSTPEPEDIKPLIITDKGNNKAEIVWHDGSIEQITFRSDNIAYGEISVLERCFVGEIFSASNSVERENVPVVNVYDFTPIRGKETMYVHKRTQDTDEFVVAQWQSAKRTIE